MSDPRDRLTKVTAADMITIPLEGVKPRNGPTPTSSARLANLKIESSNVSTSTRINLSTQKEPENLHSDNAHLRTFSTYF